jgi:hypothetical protein
MPEIQLKTKKGFLDGHVYAKRGSTIIADEFRAKDLHRLGLVDDYEVKEAEDPENKEAPVPDNKSAPKPSTKKKA